MSSFKKKEYTDPVICNQENQVQKDWYVFFRIRYAGKVYKFKRREGINRIKNLEEKLIAIKQLTIDIAFDLENGWNPIIDPKREKEYNPYRNNIILKKEAKKAKQKEIFDFYYLKYLNELIN